MCTLLTLGSTASLQGLPNFSPRIRAALGNQNRKSHATLNNKSLEHYLPNQNILLDTSLYLEQPFKTTLVCQSVQNIDLHCNLSLLLSSLVLLLIAICRTGNYSHWAWGDMDLLFGDVANLVPASDLDDFDLITFSPGYGWYYTQGQFTILKNNDHVNYSWKVPCLFFFPPLLSTLLQQEGMFRAVRAAAKIKMLRKCPK